MAIIVHSNVAFRRIYGGERSHVIGLSALGLYLASLALPILATVMTIRLST